MKVSFINPPVVPFRKIMRNFDCATESKGNYLYQPYDFLLLSSRLPKDVEFTFIDAIAAKLNFSDCYLKLQDFMPDVIVCSVAATNWKQDLEFVQDLRTQFPESFLFTFGDILIEDHAANVITPFVDGILCSAVDFDFSLLKNRKREDFKPELYEGLRKADSYKRTDLKAPKKISLSNIRHQDFLHPAYRWPFSRHFTYTTVFTSWGCPYSCSYCIMSKFPNLWRDYSEIIEEMRQIKNWGIKEIYIGDRSFGLPVNNVLNLLDQMIEENFNFSWSTYFHPNQYRADLLEKMKKAGCHTIIIGIESSDQKELTQYSRYVRQNQLQELLQHANKIGIDVCADFIIGLPHDGPESILETIKFSQNIPIDYASFNVAAPLAGTIIREQAISNGQMTHDDQFDSLGRTKAISVSKIPATEVMKLKNQAVIGFYTRPSYLMKRLFKIRGYQHLVIQVQEALQILLKSWR